VVQTCSKAPEDREVKKKNKPEGETDEEESPLCFCTGGEDLRLGPSPHMRSDFSRNGEHFGGGKAIKLILRAIKVVQDKARGVQEKIGKEICGTQGEMSGD